MAYVEKYVGLVDAIKEIARVEFGGDLVLADANLLTALQDDTISALSNEADVGPLSWESRYKFYVSAHHWGGSSILSNTSWRRYCVLRRADLLKIYPDLWKDARSDSHGTAQGQSVAGKNNSGRTQPISDAELKKWFQGRIAEFDGKSPPSEREDYNAAKTTFGPRVTRERIRKLRHHLAPDDWNVHTRGRKNK